MHRELLFFDLLFSDLICFYSVHFEDKAEIDYLRGGAGEGGRRGGGGGRRRCTRRNKRLGPLIVNAIQSLRFLSLPFKKKGENDACAWRSWSEELKKKW